MKTVLLAALFLPTVSIAGLCDRYTNDQEKWHALEVVSLSNARTMDETCNSTRIVDIEIQPSQVVIDGQIIPHMAVYLHYSEESCKYMVERSEFTLTSSYCYPTW